MYLVEDNSFIYARYLPVLITKLMKIFDYQSTKI